VRTSSVVVVRPRFGAVEGVVERFRAKREDLKTFTWKPRPESGLDCLTRAIFGSERTAAVVVVSAGFGSVEGVVERRDAPGRVRVSLPPSLSPSAPYLHPTPTPYTLHPTPCNLHPEPCVGCAHRRRRGCERRVRCRRGCSRARPRARPRLDLQMRAAGKFARPRSEPVREMQTG